MIDNQFIDQLTLSAWAVALLEYLKRSGWFPVLSEASTNRIKWFFAAFTSAMVTAGLHLEISGNLSTGLDLHMVGITSEKLFSAAWLLLKSFTTQELIFRGVVKRATIKK